MFILSKKNLLIFLESEIINANRRKIILIGIAEGKKINPIRKNNLPNFLKL